MKSSKTIAIILPLSIIVFSAYSCTDLRYLKTERAEPLEISGTYSLFLFGNRFGEDIENVAILDKEGDGYTFEIYAPQYDYSVQRGIPSKDALEASQKHAGSHRSFLRSRLSRIYDQSGNIIGYELRPLYHAFEFGYQDVLTTYYRIKDDRVIATIRLRYELEYKEPFGRSGTDRFTD